MHNSYHYLIFDVNLLFHQAYNSLLSEKSNLTKVDFQDFVIFPQVIKESIHRINSIINRYGTKESKVYLLFDNPDTQINIRKLISQGEYKKTREQKGIQRQLFATLDILFNIVIHYNGNWNALKGESLEADDLTKPLVELLKPDKDTKCLCISTDRDWARNIANNIHWCNWSKV